MPRKYETWDEMLERSSRERRQEMRRKQIETTRQLAVSLKDPVQRMAYFVTHADGVTRETVDPLWMARWLFVPFKSARDFVKGGE